MVKRDLDGVLPLRVGSCFCRAFWPQYQLYTVVVSRATLVQKENATAAVTNLSYKSSNQPEHRTSPLAPAVLTWVVFFGGSTLLELALSVRTPKDSQHVLAFWHVQRSCASRVPSAPFLLKPSRCLRAGRAAHVRN